jgi:hypothetical protein
LSEEVHEFEQMQDLEAADQALARLRQTIDTVSVSVNQKAILRARLDAGAKEIAAKRKLAQQQMIEQGMQNAQRTASEAQATGRSAVIVHASIGADSKHAKLATELMKKYVCLELCSSDFRSRLLNLNLCAYGQGCSGIGVYAVQ